MRNAQAGIFRFCSGAPAPDPEAGRAPPPCTPRRDFASLVPGVGWVGLGGASLRSPGLPFWVALGAWVLGASAWSVRGLCCWPSGGRWFSALASRLCPGALFPLWPPCRVLRRGPLALRARPVFWWVAALSSWLCRLFLAPRASARGGSCRVFLASGGLSLASAGVPGSPVFRARFRLAFMAGSRPVFRCVGRPFVRSLSGFGLVKGVFGGRFVMGLGVG